MPLCQILIQGNNGTIPPRAYYQIGASGRYKARIVGIDFIDQTPANSHRLIKIRSDCFRIPYGTNRDILLPNKKDGSPSSHPSGEYQFLIECMANNIDIELISDITYGGGGNDDFKFCIINLELKEFENSLSQNPDLRM